MKRIYEPTELVYHLLGKQEIDENKEYRRFFYLTECPVEGGYVILNTITYELIFLTNEEIALLNNPDLDNDLVRYLAEQYFLVPEDYDDKKLGTQVIDSRMQIQNIYRDRPLTFFCILTTTGCNARCFYCFEKGAKVSNMTEKTAHDVADFIERKGDKKVRIQWFGGEPLVNIKAIDTICEDLKSKNVNYESTMVSNAYLFDENVIEKAVNLWKLQRIQITLDGTEEVYNKTKDYVYKNVSSPFKRVLNNIENALKAGIQISIRLNLGEHNTVDLSELSKILVERFNKYKNCYIYVVKLFDDPCGEGIVVNEDTRHKLTEKLMELQKFIDNNMPKPYIDKLPQSFELPNTCMANNDRSVMIVPDGHLGKCEHFVDSEFYGSIYSDDIDFAMIKKFKEYVIVGSECYDCELRSTCMPLKCCTAIPKHCDEIDKNAMLFRLHGKLKNVYNKFLELEENNK